MDGKTTRASTLDDALAALRRGEAIGLPTETVYGLAADAHDPAAVRRIYALKGRPSDHPLIVHVADAVTASRWAGDWPDAAEALAEAFWPGPLTLILPRAANVPDEVTGGQDTVGLRVPAHPVAQALLKAFEGGVAAPSANRFGRLSPTTAAHVREEFGDAVPIVLDGGECEIGLESTIVDLSNETPRILRPGKISRPEIEDVIGPVAEGKDGDSPRASGTLASHYAPRAHVRVITDPAAFDARILSDQHRSRPADEPASARVGFIALASVPTPPGLVRLIAPADTAEYARSVYSALREADAQHLSLVVAVAPPPGGIGDAIRDRLERAATRDTTQS